MGSVSQDAEGLEPSPMLATLLEAEATNERTLAAARAEAARIVSEARERTRRDDEALAREIDGLRRNDHERLKMARLAELESLAKEGNERAARFAALTRDRADALAEDVLRRLLNGGMP